MASKRVSAVSSLPAYGEEISRLDATARPPRYTFIAEQDASSPADLPTHSRFVGRDYGQGAGVIQNWQQEQRSTSRGQKSKHGGDGYRGLWASTVQKAKARKQTTMMLAALLVICIVVVIVVPVVVVRNKNSRKAE